MHRAAGGPSAGHKPKSINLAKSTRVRLGAQQCRIHAPGVDPRCSRDHLRAIEVREVIIGSHRMPSDSHSRVTLPSTVGVV